MTISTPRTVHIAGISLTNLSLQQASEYLAGATTEGRGLDVHLVNAYTISLMDTMPELRRVIRSAALNFADGKPLTWAARSSGQRLAQVPGPDLFEAVLASGHRYGLRHFFLGGTDDTLEKLRQTVAARHPSAELAGWWSPPFRPLTAADRDQQDETIRASGAHIVWVGLGTPKQDFEAARIARELGITAVAIGAAFDFSSGTLRRAPNWIGQVGLEWLFRFAMEPRRLWRRYTVGNLKFLRAMVRWSRSAGSL